MKFVGWQSQRPQIGETKPKPLPGCTHTTESMGPDVWAPPHRHGKLGPSGGESCSKKSFSMRCED